MKTLATLLLLLPLATACAGSPSKSELDAEVKRLCAIDGGVKVYETVKLPSSEFDKWGMVKLYSEQRKDAPEARRNDEKQTVIGWMLGAGYFMKWSIYYYRQGNPSMMQHHFEIIRRADGKLLGETVSYGRGGGDMHGPWHDSKFTCPETAIAGPNALLNAIFMKANVTKGEQ